ncbi:exocyst complex component Sec3-domain-containing protein [Boeremia exigua]|uniref:exocyst complex component Sec3-domain-containing protein n=1 Tax=Boeremia exigua TaxID=749465 RepID=UPI001E8E44A2|nr:exocyst complex component Sec3-domain-containing protein [Boeremia exigua]KAH6633236.1 exocyst complex component Sec3-domain-containing protein [Boeremia exigua]
MDGRPRNNYPNGLGDPRAPGRGPAPGASRGPPSTTSSGAASSSMSRAERFDDERRRITESCFAKVDDQGQLQESYITHIRVTEDAVYPQSPAPPTSAASNKKGRIIMISVRNTGRVKLHKARENANGSFSIGKTWPMEDLTAVENFVQLEPKSQEEEQKKQWAGEKGFMVTISKPYYWEAGTAKEKEFFIGSMVKIYNKYTKGDFPILSGFGAAELNSLTNGRPHLATAEGKASAKLGGREELQDPAVQRQFPPKSPGPPPRRPGDFSSAPSDEGRRGPTPQTSNPNFRRPPGEFAGPRRPGQDERGGSRPSTGDDARRPSPFNQNQNMPPVPSLRQKPSMEQSIRSRPSGESMRPRQQMRDPVPPTPPMPSQNLTPQSSTSAFGVRPETPQSGGDFVPNLPSALSPGRRVQADDARSQRSQRSFDEQSFESASANMPPPEQRRQNGFPSPRRDISPRGLRPGTAQSNASSITGRVEDMPPEAPPQRRRPFMDSQPSSLSQQSAVSTDNEGGSFRTPSATPPPPLEVPPRRRPQDIPDRLKPASRDGSAPPQNMPQAMPPPTSPLPPPPPAVLPEPPAPVTVPAPEPAPAPAPVPAPAPEPVAVEEPPVQQQAPSEPAAAQPAEASLAAAEEKESQAGANRFPMLKKTVSPPADAANKFRKLAAAAGAFKPRAGGAAAKLLAKETKTSDEPDGISGVFVPKRLAPVEAPKEEAVEKKADEPGSRPTSSRASRDLPKITTDAVPAVTVSGPLSPVPAIEEPQPELAEEEALRAPTPEALEATTADVVADPEPRKKKRRSNQQVMNISKLGIDPSIMDERGLGFESLLTELGWGGSDITPKHIETLEIDIKREIARVEAGSWLNHLEQKDDRVEAVERMLDRAIAECDEMEGLLTLYNVELSSLNDDIAFIEAQSQGLQVQTANQRLLQHELRQLVETISITTDQLEVLRRAPIGKLGGLNEIEDALVLLYKALLTIDPAFVAGRGASLGKATSSSGFGNSELATMQALQEKRDNYLGEGAMFLDRLKKHMEITFGAAFLTTMDALKQIDQGSMPSLRKNIEAHDAGRSELWMLSPVILFAKEIDRNSWDTLIRMYQGQAAQLYQQEVRDNMLAWRRFARKPGGDEQDLLFTSTQEKEPESMAGTARKLTVKRSQTLARGLRSASGDKETKVVRAPQDGKLHAFDVFGRVLDDIGPVLLTEQNFITEFFHATSTDAIDFPDAVASAPPQSRRGPNLWIRKQFEADRSMAKRVADVMEDIFSFWPTEIQSLVDWAVGSDPLQGVGILTAVDRKLVDIEDSNQDFLTRTLQKIHERLKGLFSRFLDEQIRAIEDTKVKIKKRKGVIAFMKTFPHFSMAIENMLLSPSDGGDQLEIRRMVNDGYQRINKAMFESLKVIAKESPTVMGTQGQGDPEDKEALNYHILLIENMNHYMEEVDARPDTVLDYWKGKAQDEYTEHMNLYVDAVVRRPLGKLLEFIESTETLLAARGGSPVSIAQRSSHSRSVFKKLVNSHDAKEMRKGIEALKKRVDKHFGDADDPSISRDLVFKVLKECERKYIGVGERVQRINQDVYQGEVEVDWGTNEVQGAFRR